MAERRMFAKTIVLSDSFLDMGLGSRCLYFTLSMFADDDGFVNNPKSIMRQCGATDDDMKVLIAKKFVITFDDGVIVIKHWRINNYLRNDRYTETKYIDDKAQLTIDSNGSYTTTGIPVGIPSNGIPSIGKDSIDKVSIDNTMCDSTTKYPESFEAFWKLYPNKKCGKQNAYKSFQRAIKTVEIGKMLVALKQHIHSPDWTKDNGKYVPMATTWLNQGRWDAELPQGGTECSDDRYRAVKYENGVKYVLPKSKGKGDTPFWQRDPELASFDDIDLEL